MKILPLGVGGWIPNEYRQTACVILIKKDHCVIFDLGTGISRLLEPRFKTLLNSISRLDIVLSHFHLDHCVGLTWLPKIWGKEFSIYAPTKPWVDCKYLDALDKLTTPPFFALPLNKYPGGVDIIPIKKTEIQIGEFEITVIPQIHSGGSLGFRVGKNFAYITDVDPDEKHVEFMKNVKLAFVDTMYDRELYTNATVNFTKKTDHGYSEGVAVLCKEADIVELGLIHLNPGFGIKETTNLLSEARRLFKNTFIPEEGKMINGSF